ncbi:MAG: hypothetical protein CMJ96_00075 [Planctomycetes bacterium]|nr:hypothetical protein [Planctomycetota bacterium]
MFQHIPQAVLAFFVATSLLSAQGSDPTLEAWRLNLDGTTGTSVDPGINASISNIEADVTGAVYTNAHVFVDAEGIPSHTIGPWNFNPNTATARNWTWRIPRNPQPATTHAETSLGQIGTMVNGVPFFNMSDGRSYHNRRVWEQDAIYFEGQSMDVGLGHPQQTGDYHYHSYPRLLAGQRGDSPRDHSPILGFAFDGYPIYGPYAFLNPDGTGGLKKMETSYRLRNITQRRSLPDGTQLSSGDWGPDVSSQYPLGCYLQDNEYVVGLGDLDEFNGRFGMTPEYPQGTYAYYMTLDASGEPAYPYLVGPTYYGVVDSANIGPGSGHISPPGTAVDYTPLALYVNDVVAGGIARIAVGNCGPGARVFLGYSLAGSGPLNTPWGVGALSPPIKSIGPYTSNINGLVSIQAPVPGMMQGKTIYAQAVSTPQGGTTTLSSPARVTVQ